MWLEEWKRPVDRGVAYGALHSSLSKAFDCLDHELIIAKLNSCGFNCFDLKLLHNYLSHRQ